MAISKRCVNCKGLFQGPKCPKCSKQYNKKRREENEALKLYGSYLWKQCRKNIRIRFFDYDIWLMAIGQEYVCKDEVIIHHILERDERPDLIFTLDNLITVSRQSHEEIHQQYKVDKEAAIARIMKGIENFYAKFGV